MSVSRHYSTQSIGCMRTHAAARPSDGPTPHAPALQTLEHFKRWSTSNASAISAPAGLRVQVGMLVRKDADLWRSTECHKGASFHTIFCSRTLFSKHVQGVAARRQTRGAVRGGSGARPTAVRVVRRLASGRAARLQAREPVQDTLLAL